MSLEPAPSCTGQNLSHPAVQFHIECRQRTATETFLILQICSTRCSKLFYALSTNNRMQICIIIKYMIMTAFRILGYCQILNIRFHWQVICQYRVYIWKCHLEEWRKKVKDKRWIAKLSLALCCWQILQSCCPSPMYEWLI